MGREQSGQNRGQKPIIRLGNWTHWTAFYLRRWAHKLRTYSYDVQKRATTAANKRGKH